MLSIKYPEIKEKLVNSRIEMKKKFIADNPFLLDEVTINRYELIDIFAGVAARIKSQDLTVEALLIMSDIIDAIFDEDGEDEED